jgi:hypothetical protein
MRNQRQRHHHEHEYDYAGDDKRAHSPALAIGRRGASGRLQAVPAIYPWLPSLRGFTYRAIPSAAGFWASGTHSQGCHFFTRPLELQNSLTSLRPARAAWARMAST